MIASAPASTTAARQQFAACQLLKYMFIAWQLLKRDVRERIAPRLDAWIAEHGIPRVADPLERLADIWIDSLDVAREVLGDQAEELMPGSGFEPGELETRISKHLKDDANRRLDGHLLLLLRSDLFDLQEVILEMKDEVLLRNYYEEPDNDKIKEFVARARALMNNDSHRTLVLKAVVIILHQESSAWARRHAGYAALPWHFALLTADAFDLAIKDVG